MYLVRPCVKRTCGGTGVESLKSPPDSLGLPTRSNVGYGIVDGGHQRVVRNGLPHVRVE